ncbi:MAG: hypothetical protein ACXVCP_01445 [Bdellovibrio sp.]
MKTEFDSIADTIKLKIFGRIDEMSVFPKFEGQTISKLSMDLISVEGINSMGILYWIRWWKDLTNRNPGITFQIENARMNMISSASVVVGFLPPQTEILSFFLPYHNEVEGQTIQELMKKGINYDDKKMTVLEEIKKVHEGKEITFELDCFPTRDLRCFNLEIDVV